MGLFDYVEVEMDLPGLPDSFTPEFQTKSFDPSYLDHYRIDEDGVLWHQSYDIEDRSDPNAEGLRRFMGMATRVNKRWHRVPTFTGEVNFYDFDHETDEWFEYMVFVENGHVTRGPIRIEAP